MAFLDIDADNALFYLHTPPEGDKPTFVFVNALTGTTDHWEAVVAPALRAGGYGTLTYNFRGQSESRYGDGLELTPVMIVEDLVRICKELGPSRPILVGLSVGGLFAAQAIRDGVEAAGLVYLNTIREIGPRIDWANDALGIFASKTGVSVWLAAIYPMLVNPEFLKASKPNMLPIVLSSLADDHPHANLMRNSASADWAFPWDSLSLPTLNITGLCDRVYLDKPIVDGWLDRLADVERIEWEDCGHLIQLERPQRLAEALGAFGARLTP